MLCFSKTQLFAQSKLKPKEVIIVVFSHSADYSFDGIEFPINKTSKRMVEVSDGVVSECAFPDKPECADFVYSSFEISGGAFVVSKNQAKIKLKAEIAVGDKECRINRTFTIYRNRKTKIPLNSCGAKLTAYYGFESKKTD